MKKHHTFCENCREEVSYTVTSAPMSGTIRGTEYPYSGKEATCSNCGAPVYIAEINDFNLKALYDEFRKANGIISLEHILEIPKKYDIGKRPLSLLLGWGEQTFSRYCDGDMPTRQYSYILNKIYDNPEYYSEILEKGKSNLKSLTSYSKSKKAVNKLLTLEADTKISCAIKYLLNQCEDITPLALQKALYYIQGFYSAFYNDFIFSEDCEAWAHGPVYRDIYFRYRDYQFDPISSCEEFDKSVLSVQERSIFDSVVNHLCCYSGKVLEQFTHNETPWIRARNGLPVGAPSNRIISQESIHEYFYSVKEKYNMITPDDIHIYAQKMFLRI